MIGDRHCRGSSVGHALHHDVTAALANLSEPMLFKNGTDLTA